MAQVLVVLEVVSELILLIQQIVAAYRSTIAESNPMVVPLANLDQRLGEWFAKVKELTLSLQPK